MAEKMVRKRVFLTVLGLSLLMSYLVVTFNNIAQSITLDTSNNPYSINSNGSVSSFNYKPDVKVVVPQKVVTESKSIENEELTKKQDVEFAEPKEVVISPQDQAYLDYKDNFMQNGAKRVENVCRDSFGFALLKDYNNKIYVIKTLEGSNAEISGVSIGDQVVKINNKKYKTYKKKSTEQIMNMITSQNKIALVLKSITGDKKQVSLSKSNVCFSQTSYDDIYTSYWQQLFPDESNISESLALYNEMSFIPFSGRLSAEISKQISFLQYWKKKEKVFSNQYKACLVSSFTNEAFHDCVKLAVTKDIEEIRHEENIALEKEKMESQERMQRWGVYASVMNSMAIFDHANALRNQHVNVNHSGNVNVNHSGSFNVRLDKGYNW